MDTFGKMFSFLIAIAVLVLWPMQYTAQRQDQITQTYLQSTTQAFVNEIRNQGYLSADMYNSFIEDIDATGNLYNVGMIAAHEQYDPIYDSSGNFINDYQVNYYCRYENDILDSVHSSTGKFTFSKGDYLTITVVNRNDTMSSKLQRYLGNISADKNQILIVAGGMIRDENY